MFSLEDKYEFFELNVPKQFKGKSAYTIKEVINLCNEYSKDGFELYFVAQPYIVFRRKRGIFERLKLYLKSKRTNNDNEEEVSNDGSNT